MSKVQILEEAISTHVRDGMSIALGCALESLIPFAASHEIIRQRQKDLTLIGPISDIQFDQLIGAGCVRKIQASWVGNVAAGLGHNFRRAAEAAIRQSRWKSRNTPILPSAWLSRQRRWACPSCRPIDQGQRLSPKTRTSAASLPFHRRRAGRGARDSPRRRHTPRATCRRSRQCPCLGKLTASCARPRWPPKKSF